MQLQCQAVSPSKLGTIQLDLVLALQFDLRGATVSVALSPAAVADYLRRRAPSPPSSAVLFPIARSAPSLWIRRLLGFSRIRTKKTLKIASLLLLLLAPPAFVALPRQRLPVGFARASALIEHPAGRKTPTDSGVAATHR
ncbi:hypothetical protein O181_032237 [Austropuccinia psidii MF-1]|uniref:Uncharacterized protein n=1 Tax=Austropuccinia psidii MF-1 TaxID=1389203 RepID=A0A9Q3H629_9BASI|nr:hypothetical protein [Austropuccinia psidii MF-1]